MRSAHRFSLPSLLLCWTAFFAPAQTAPPPPSPALGINLAGPSDWNTEFPFADTFRFSRPWISHENGKPFGKGPPLQTDRDGWLLSLPPNCSAEAFLSTSPRKPAGKYTVSYEGNGTISFSQAVSATARKQGLFEIDVADSPSPLSLKIEKTDPSDPIRNIRIFSHLPSEGVWRKGFLDLWSGVRCLRFMDFMKTNDSPLRRWEDRPLVSDASFAKNGVPLELLLDLANRLHANPWFCIPHQADDDFVRRFAEQIRDNLDPTLFAYIEYSNEVWNSQFSQHRYASENGIRLNLAEKPWEAAWLFTAKRSVEIFQIFSEVFGEKRNFLRVLAIQSGQNFMAEKMLSFNGTHRHIDALASAPYLTLSPAETPDRHHPLAAKEVADWTLDELFSHLENEVLPRTTRAIRDNAAIAKKYGIPLVAYEGGQHLAGVRGAENDNKLTSLFHAANRSERMALLYRRYLAAWQQEGGGLFCHFSSVSQWTKWGSWGLMEFYDSPPLDQPKFRALAEWADSIGQPFPKKLD